MSGVTYYKLSKDIYPGDTTKGCGLTGPEIDANFHFLRGYDIKSGDLNPENGVITLYRLNGDKIEIEGLAELLSGLTDFNLDESYYDPSDGTLHLFVNGVEQSAITGFFTYADIHTDCTLEGDGSENNPLKIAKEFVEGIDAEIKEAVDKEKEERQEADSNLNEKIEEETHRATESERALAEAFGQALNAEAQERQQADENLSQRITEEIGSREALGEALDAEIERANGKEQELQEAINSEKERAEAAENAEKARAEEKESELQSKIEAETERAKDAESGLTEDIAELDSAFTESLSEISSEISAITDSINELEEKVTDVTLTEDVVISENSPLYPFISGIWPDNIIKDGTTFTDFVKALCSEDMRKVYYISTDKRLSYYIDDDRRVRRISDFHETETALALSSGFTIDIEEGSLNCIILLPFGRDLISVKTNEGGEPYIQDLFENKGICLVSEPDSLNNKYNAYAYKTIESSASSNEEFYVRIV